jgi:hypothetical protein
VPETHPQPAPEAEGGKEKEATQEEQEKQDGQETIDTSFPARDGPQIAQAPSSN